MLTNKQIDAILNTDKRDTTKEITTMKRTGLYFTFTTNNGKEILIDAHCWTLKQATEWATREDASAKYSGTKLFF